MDKKKKRSKRGAEIWQGKEDCAGGKKIQPKKKGYQKVERNPLARRRGDKIHLGRKKVKTHLKILEMGAEDLSSGGKGPVWFMLQTFMTWGFVRESRCRGA